MTEQKNTQDGREIAKAPHRLFGEIAVARGLVTPEQVRNALEVQEDLRRMDMPEKIGQILIKREVLERDQVLAILKEQGVKPIQEIIEGFEILEKVGQGGMGAVFRARQSSTGREVALKILPPRFNRDSLYLRRFYREARVAAQLNHPNIVQCLDTGESRGHHFIAMEFVRGKGLDALLAERGRMEERETLEIAEQICRALDHAHRRNLIHRDVKPSNIMIAEDGAAKLLDLGLAKAVSASGSSETDRITQTGMAVGTPSFISPEQAQSAQDIDIRADIYSLGATLFTMLTGRPPFSAGSAAALLVQHISAPVPKANEAVPTVSEGATRLIEIMLAKSREERFRNPQELLEAILDVRDGRLPGGPALPPPGGENDVSRSSPTLQMLEGVRAGVGRTAGTVGHEVRAWFAQPFFLATAAAGAVMLLAAAILAATGFGRAHKPLPPGPAPAEAAQTPPTRIPAVKEPAAVPAPDPKGTPGADPDAPPDLDALRRALADTRELVEDSQKLRELIQEFQNQNARTPGFLLDSLRDVLLQIEGRLQDLESLDDKLRERGGKDDE